MSILQDFKTFAMRGNVVDLAVGVIIGTAFGKIVSSLVENIIMPPLGVLISNVDFKDLGILLSPADAATGKPAAILGYGAFLQNTLDFLIIAWAVFLMVRLMNKFAPKPAPAAPKGPTAEELLVQIRDLLKAETKAPAKKK